MNRMRYRIQRDLQSFANQGPTQISAHIGGIILKVPTDFCPSHSLATIIVDWIRYFLVIPPGLNWKRHVQKTLLND